MFINEANLIRSQLFHFCEHLYVFVHTITHAEDTLFPLFHSLSLFKQTTLQKLTVPQFASLVQTLPEPGNVCINIPGVDLISNYFEQSYIKGTRVERLTEFCEVSRLDSPSSENVPGERRLGGRF